ncbi:hypothetical protein MLD38_040468 [Melastoma candidum]|nr:hypothetical protein MLD38_040468 [Melastoma candidum]
MNVLSGGGEAGDRFDFIETDPTGRYGRYDEILGKGASKTVYRAFDEYKGIEVAWNQVKLRHFLRKPEDMERLYCEIHLLGTLNHRNIIKFYSSWVDPVHRNINFVTEMFTSGTLRQYRMKHRRVNIRAVKHWCRQILQGLLYLHSLDPPVIHRDLKCDNIFINGNQGEVKIGDLGLAAILRKSHAAHCVGTPEFMAPEVYKEAYNELVDIYSFGMCILEMVTFEYPYSECTNPAQIYKKVISGKKPEALYKVTDPDVRNFVEKCLATVSSRPSARELLDDPFLRIDGIRRDRRSMEYGGEVGCVSPLRSELSVRSTNGAYSNGYFNGFGYESYGDWKYHPAEIESAEIDLFEPHKDDNPHDLDTSIDRKRGDDDGIFLRLRISGNDGKVRIIYFPFDIEMDTAMSVATEMVAELDLDDHDVAEIAEMIDGQVSSLVPEWRLGPGFMETPQFLNQSFSQNYASNHTSTSLSSGSVSLDLGSKIMQSQCCWKGCASMHGRFEEITYKLHNLDGNVSGQESCEHSHASEGYESLEETLPAASLVKTGREKQISMNSRDDDPISSSSTSSVYYDLSDYEDLSQGTSSWPKSEISERSRARAGTSLYPDYEVTFRAEPRVWS